MKRGLNQLAPLDLRVEFLGEPQNHGVSFTTKDPIEDLQKFEDSQDVVEKTAREARAMGIECAEPQNTTVLVAHSSCPGYCTGFVPSSSTTLG